MLKRLLPPLLLLLLAAPAASAQQSYEDDFFARKSPTAYRYNPAILGETGYVGVLNFSLSSRANYGARNFLFEYGDEVVTALHSSVSAEEFLGGLKPISSTLQMVSLNIFSYGFRKDDAFHTFELNFNEFGASSIARDFFEIAKTGFKKGRYDLGHTHFQFNGYAELAYGYSRRLSDIVSVGARAKLLVGLGSLHAGINRFNVDVESEDWTADVSVDFEATGRRRNPDDKPWKLTFDRKYYSRTPKRLSGAGLAFDLGVLIQPNEYLTLSASANNLGFLCWSYGRGADLSASFSLMSVLNCIQEHTTESLMESLMNIGSDLMESVNYEKMDKTLRMRAIPFGFNLGIKYAMPFYDRLSLGLTGHYTLYDVLSYWETRLGLTVTPWDWLELSGSYGFGTYKSTYAFTAAAKVDHFRLTLSMQDGFGGKVPGTSFHFWQFNRYVSLGLAYVLD